MSRRLILIAAAIALIAAGSVTAVNLLGHGSGSNRPHTLAGGRALASRACNELAHVEELVRRNAPAPEVFAASKKAAADATAASFADGTWVPLASGLQLLDAALHSDDAGATRQALDLISAHCTPTPH